MSYRCHACNWRGDDPSWTNTDAMREDPVTGRQYLDQRTIAICPECFNDAVKIPDLSQALIDITRAQACTSTEN
jgi:hypothetical protein